MEEVGAVLHRCGACLQTFTDEALYLVHQCESTGVTPEHPLHGMGENFLEIQAASLQRGADAARASGDTETADRTEAHIQELIATSDETTADTTGQPVDNSALETAPVEPVEPVVDNSGFTPNPPAHADNLANTQQTPVDTSAETTEQVTTFEDLAKEE